MQSNHLGRHRDDDSESEYEDPLFGTQKKRKLRTPNHSKAPRMKQSNIFDALKSQTSKRDALTSELGFPIKETVPVSSLKVHKELGHVENKIERTKQVTTAIQDHQQRVNTDKLLDTQAAEFVKKYVNKHFRESMVELGGVMVYENKEYLDNLQEQIKESIKLKDNTLIPARFMFFIRKCQPSRDEEYYKCLQSQNPTFITHYEFSEDVILEHLLKSLGCDIKMLERYPKKRFDNKNPLPDNFALEIMKFAQAVMYSELNPENRETIIKASVLLLLDENVQNDLNTVRFKGSEKTANQLVFYILSQASAGSEDEAIEYISNFCQQNPELWYTFLSRLCCDNETIIRKRHLLARLLLTYIAEVNCYDTIKFKFVLGEEYDTTSNQLSQMLTTKLIEYVSIWSKCTILEYHESQLGLVLNKVRCLERLFLLLYDLIKKSPQDTEMLTVSILRFKRNYFKNYSNSLSPIIPTVRSILDFILKELDCKKVTDFFASERE